MRQDENAHPGAAEAEGPGNEAWQRTKYLMAQMQGRRN